MFDLNRALISNVRIHIRQTRVWIEFKFKQCDDEFEDS